MKIYPRSVGDMAAAVQDLSLLEIGIFNILIDYYYSSESGFDEKTAKKITKISKKNEKLALTNVLQKLFIMGEDGIYRNARCEKELKRYRMKSDQAKQAVNTRWAKHRGDTDVSKPNDTGVSKKSIRTYKIRMPSRNTTHEPYSYNSSSILNEGKPPVDKSVDNSADPLAQLAGELRSRGMVITDTDPHLRSWIQGGKGFNLVIEALEIAQKRRALEMSDQPIGPAYVDAILRNSIQADKDSKPREIYTLLRPHASESEIDEMANKLEIHPRKPGEALPEYARRVNREIEERTRHAA